MAHFSRLSIKDDLSGNWCNDDAVISSLMEAVSFVTPILENYFIRTVAEALMYQIPHELKERCREFIREESAHSRTHKKFNASLQFYLGSLPPGIAPLESLLNNTKKRFSLQYRLLLAAALEHFAAVISKDYTLKETQLNFRSSFARELFAEHAREELAHRSVVFDLWLNRKTANSIERSLTVTTILISGFLYIAFALPWILYRKKNYRIMSTLGALTHFTFRHLVCARTYTPLREIFAFVRRDYHPDQLIDNSSVER
jgi:predicted metal-dependent hydrolase